MSDNTVDSDELELHKKRIAELEEALKINQKSYEIVVGFSGISIFDYNVKTKKIMVPPEDFAVYGLPGIFENGVEELIATGIIEERSKDDIRELYGKIDQGVVSASTIVHARDLKGIRRTLELQIVNIFDKEGKPIHGVGIRRDITEEIKFRKEMEYTNLLTSELTFIYEANVTQDTIIRYDENWADEVGLNKIRTLTGVLQMMCELHVAPENKKTFYEKQSREYMLAAFRKGKRIITFEYRRLAGDKGYQWYEVRVNLIEDEITKDIYMRVYIENIDARKKREISLIHRAQHDFMTGFFNKNAVEEQITEFLYSERGRSGTHVFFIIDIDYFKGINDQFGHAFGDAVLSKTANKIRSLFRADDILGRVGGDEFVAFMKNVANDEIAILKAQEICDRVATDYAHDGLECKLTVSVGIAMYSSHGTTYGELYNHSDIALYDVKENGRNRIAIYEEGMHHSQE